MAEQRCPGCGLSKVEFARHLGLFTDAGRADDRVLAQIARNEPASRPMTRDHDAADRVAGVVASWAFPLTVLALIALWLIINVAWRPFEPFPAVFLAVLSATLASVAALQGPIILRVQRRQRERDHERDEIDHRVNLRAELEIRWLDHKLDHLLEPDGRTTRADDNSAPRGRTGAGPASAEELRPEP